MLEGSGGSRAALSGERREVKAGTETRLRVRVCRRAPRRRRPPSVHPGPPTQERPAPGRCARWVTAGPTARASLPGPPPAPGIPAYTGSEKARPRAPRGNPRPGAARLLPSTEGSSRGRPQPPPGLGAPLGQSGTSGSRAGQRGSPPVRSVPSEREAGLGASALPSRRGAAGRGQAEGGHRARSGSRGGAPRLRPAPRAPPDPAGAPAAASRRPPPGPTCEAAPRCQAPSCPARPASSRHPGALPLAVRRQAPPPPLTRIGGCHPRRAQPCPLDHAASPRPLAGGGGA
ncbi:basic proline-rich protein-like [Neopsephotus bourkii]|uniref:basic proline-rich protein-like n=1 Tax=Neopsephotus bourkii TaxID=309878 RepID=UPI002AA4FFC0|nr:basic proline-rich protein-like [Neopsephotus bourkii]